jgi:hypothetical protein
MTASPPPHQRPPSPRRPPRGPSFAQLFTAGCVALVLLMTTAALATLGPNNPRGDELFHACLDGFIGVLGVLIGLVAGRGAA